MAMDPKILDYFRKKGVLPEGYDQAEQGVADAQQMQGYAGIAQAAGQLSDNFANSQKKDVIFANRMQDLGKRPEVQKAEQQKTDFSLANNLASSNTSQAQQKLEQMKADMVAKLRGQQADEKLQYDQSQDTAKMEFEREKFENSKANSQREFELKGQEIAAKGREAAGVSVGDQLKEQALIKAKRDNQQALNPKADPKSVQEASYRAKNLTQNLSKLKGIVENVGTFEAFGPESAEMDKMVYDIAIDYAKLVDPTSVAREGEVAAAQKYMLPIRNWGGLGTSNGTAKKIIDNMITTVSERAANQAPTPAPNPSGSGGYDSMSDEELMQLLNQGK